VREKRFAGKRVTFYLKNCLRIVKLSSMVFLQLTLLWVLS